MQAVRPQASTVQRRSQQRGVAEPGHWFEHDPLWFKTAVFYEIHTRAFFDSTTTAPATSAASSRSSTTCSGSGSTASGCCRSTPRRSATAATTSPTSTGSTPTTAPSRTSARSSSGARARDPRDRRPRHEPHLVRPRVVPGVAPTPDSAEERLVRLVGHRRALPGRTDHLRRHRDLELDVGPGSRPVLLAPLLQPPAGPELREPRGAGRDARGAALLARPRARRVPARRRALPLRGGGDELREPAARRTST